MKLNFGELEEYLRDGSNTISVRHHRHRWTTWSHRHRRCCLVQPWPDDGTHPSFEMRLCLLNTWYEEAMYAKEEDHYYGVSISHEIAYFEKLLNMKDSTICGIHMC